MRSMTAPEALEEASTAPPGERLRRYKSECAARGACKREPLLNDPGRWTRCPNCLTIFDDYGVAVNLIPELR
jgi:hypothetical protein